MSRFAFPQAKVLALVSLCACGTDTPNDPPPVTQPDPCAEVDCGPGQCVQSSGQAACTYPAGYVPAGASCKRDVREGDDHGDTLAASTRLQPGTRGSATLDIETDADLFSFEVTAGHIYRFSCAPPQAASYKSSCRVRLLNDGGASMAGATTSDGAHGYLAGTLAPHAGILYAHVDRNPGGPTFTNDYNYTLVDLGPDDHANTPDAATVVAVGETVYGRFELNEDIDVFTLDAVAGRSYQLSCHGSETNCRMRVTRPDGTVQETPFGSTTERSSRLQVTGAQAGRHIIEVFSQTGALSSGAGSYSYSYVDEGP